MERTGGEKVRARVRVRKGSTANRAEPSRAEPRIDPTRVDSGHQPAPLAQRNNNLSSSPSPSPFPPPSLFPLQSNASPVYFPRTTTPFTRSLFIPSQRFLHPQAHPSSSRSTNKDRPSNQCKNSTRRAQWLFRLEGPQSTAR